VRLGSPPPPSFLGCFLQTGGFFGFLFLFYLIFYVLSSTLLHLPPLKFHCVVWATTASNVTATVMKNAAESFFMFFNNCGVAT
jgi:hypothetical protein